MLAGAQSSASASEPKLIESSWEGGPAPPSDAVVQPYAANIWRRKATACMIAPRAAGVFAIGFSIMKS